MLCSATFWSRRRSERSWAAQSAELQKLLRTLATLFDRLLADIGEEHSREEVHGLGTSEQRRVELIERLLAGELVDASRLGYELTGFHLGVIAEGPEAGEALRRVATSLDSRLLRIDRGGMVWAWIGGRRPTNPEDLVRLVSAGWPEGSSLATGEPGEGLAGWRLTHQQAKAAFPIALRRAEPVVRYAEVALLASILQDDVLSTSLRQLYLEPLERERDGGEVLRETLRAYYAADRNVSSAAVLLGVSRQAVTSRIRAIENTLGAPLKSYAAELEAALQIEERGRPLTA